MTLPSASTLKTGAKAVSMSRGRSIAVCSRKQAPPSTTLSHLMTTPLTFTLKKGAKAASMSPGWSSMGCVDTQMAS